MTAAVRTIRAEQVTAEAFAPFGDLLSPEGLPPRQAERPLFGVGYRPTVLESDHPVEVWLRRQDVREFRLRFLERHRELTQAFIPLGGNPFLAVVARPDAREEDEFPALEEIRAFLVPGDTGVNIRRGTWHEPPFALVDGALFLITSHARLTEGLRSRLDERGEMNRLDVEKRDVMARIGCLLRIELP